MIVLILSQLDEVITEIIVTEDGKLLGNGKDE